MYESPFSDQVQKKIRPTWLRARIPRKEGNDNYLQKCERNVNITTPRVEDVDRLRLKATVVLYVESCLTTKPPVRFVDSLTGNILDSVETKQRLPNMYNELVLSSACCGSWLNSTYYGSAEKVTCHLHAQNDTKKRVPWSVWFWDNFACFNSRRNFIVEDVKNGSYQG